MDLGFLVQENGRSPVALSDLDRDLLDRCLESDSDAWRSLVDRFLPLITHVVVQAAQNRSQVLTSTDREDIIAEVFVVLLDDDMAVLRHFQKRSSLATYIAVIGRRVAIRRMMHPSTRMLPIGVQLPIDENIDPTNEDAVASVEQRICNEEQVEMMLGGLEEPEAKVIRMFHLEGKSYTEISQRIGMPVNTIGPLLSRTRRVLRNRAGADQA